MFSFISRLLIRFRFVHPLYKNTWPNVISYWLKNKQLNELTNWESKIKNEYQELHRKEYLWGTTHSSISRSIRHTWKQPKLSPMTKEPISGTCFKHVTHTSSTKTECRHNQEPVFEANQISTKCFGANQIRSVFWSQSDQRQVFWSQSDQRPVFWSQSDQRPLFWSQSGQKPVFTGFCSVY